MDLNIIWFILITVLFTGFFILEGFDYGVGMLLLGRPKNERAQFIRSIGPVWDGNEVWMITAGGALFAAFPHVYATMFSTFYLALFLMLLALIMRGVAFELRGKIKSSDWVNFWDCSIMFGSFVPALLWGVTVTNLLRGVAINFQMHYVGTFLDLLSPCALMGGIFFVLLFAFHGANFLLIKIADEGLLHELQDRSFKLGLATLFAYVLFAAAAAHDTDILAKISTVIFLGLSIAALIASCAGAKAGVCFVDARHCIFDNRIFQRAVPAADGVEFVAEFVAGHLQRRVDAAYTVAHDGRGLRFRADCALLSILDVQNF